METWNCDSKPKIHAFWIYQSASSRQLLVQASLVDYKIGATEKTEFENLLGRLAKKWILGLSGLGSKKTNPKNNHCCFATKASHKSGDLGLLHFNFILSISRARHTLMLFVCIQIWLTTQYFQTNLSMTFLTANKSK